MHHSQGNGEEKQEQRPIELKYRECGNYENHSDSCGCWCAWYSKEGGGVNKKKVSEAATVRDLKDLHAGICANPQKYA